MGNFANFAKIFLGSYFGKGIDLRQYAWVSAKTLNCVGWVEERNPTYNFS